MEKEGERERRGQVKALDRQKTKTSLLMCVGCGQVCVEVCIRICKRACVCVWVVCGEVVGERRQKERGNDNDSRGSSLKKY